MVNTISNAGRATARLGRAAVRSLLQAARGAPGVLTRIRQGLSGPNQAVGGVSFDFRGPVTAGCAMLVVGFGGFTAWSATVPLHSAVMAPGHVAVESQRKVVQHLEGGIVSGLYVEDGSLVEAGDLLLRLDQRQASARHGQLDVRLVAAGAEKARLEAELTDAETLELDPLLAERHDDEGLSRAVALQSELFRARRDERGHRRTMLLNQAEQVAEEINGLRSQLGARERSRDLTAERLSGMRELVDKGHVSRGQMVELESQSAGLEGEVGDLTARIAGAMQKREQLVEQLRNLDAAFKMEAGERLQAVQREFSEMRESIVGADDALRRTDITAPSAGVVVGLNVHTVGAVIRGGEPLMEIVPQEDSLLIEAHVRTEDIESVHRGLPVSVRLSAFSFRSTPPVDGELIQVSADRIVDPRTNHATYLVRARLDQNSLALALGDGGQLHPGMPAEVMILGQGRTLLDYLADPIVKVAARAFREK